MNLIKAVSAIDTALRHESQRGNADADFLRKRLPVVTAKTKSFDNYVEEAIADDRG